MKTLDLNEIGGIQYYEFANNVYVGGETLAVCINCDMEDEFADSCAAIGRNAIVEIDQVYYKGEVTNLAYDYRTLELDVLLKLDWSDE